MNQRPAADRLREAMRNASVGDFDELDQAANAIGAEAVQIALAVVEQPQPPREDPEQRQRDLDSAHADAIEVVRRAQVRQGRRVFSNHDGKTVRQVYELLRSVMGPDGGADGDPSFQ